MALVVDARPNKLNGHFLVVQYVQYGDETAVTQMLRRPWDSQDQITAKLCHPLCGCDKCAKLSAQNRTDVNLVTAYTRDDRGYTGTKWLREIWLYPVL